MKTEPEIREQLALASDYLIDIEKRVPVGSGAWSRQKGYVNALEWVLDLE